MLGGECQKEKWKICNFIGCHTGRLCLVNDVSRVRHVTCVVSGMSKVACRIGRSKDVTDISLCQSDKVYLCSNRSCRFTGGINYVTLY